jgi:hypothetical protein
LTSLPADAESAADGHAFCRIVSGRPGPDGGQPQHAAPFEVAITPYAAIDISGGLACDVAKAAVGVVHAAAERGEAFAAITAFGFVARKLGTPAACQPGEHGPR